MAATEPVPPDLVTVRKDDLELALSSFDTDYASTHDLHALEEALERLENPLVREMQTEIHDDGLVRKGAAARAVLTGPSLEGSALPEFEAAADDLAWLYEAGALGGVAEILRERRRQIEQFRYTAEYDDARNSAGTLGLAIAQRILHSAAEVAEGTAGYPEVEEALRKAGALAAAETDRLHRMMGASGGKN